MTSEPLRTSSSSSLPSAQPSYILRGHSAQVHSVLFLHDNLKLLSGDADGWVVLWSIPIKRPKAVWRAHNNTILGLASWEDDKIITHGRDSKLSVWRLPEEDESDFSIIMPIENAVTDRKKPQLLHSLMVNTLNFCSFAICHSPASAGDTGNGPVRAGDVLVAVPGVHDGHVNVTALPSEDRIATIADPKGTKTGMVMAIGLHYVQDYLLVLVGYESGYACVWKQHPASKQWQTTYTYKAHSQPVLSLDIAPALGYFYTSSADAVIARHPLNDNTADTKTMQTKHAGQQSLTVRSDDKIFATAGWDGKVRVYSAKTLKELAVLKWHKEGCYALAFADLKANEDDSDNAARNPNTDGNVVRRTLTVSEQRSMRAKSTHWLAAGSKDGKASLWDIY